MAAPKTGAIIDGYRFLGGNPNDQNSWQPAGVEEVAQAKAQGTALGKAGPPVVDQNAFNDAANQLKDVRGARESVTGFWEAPIKGIPLPATIMSNTGLVGALTRGNQNEKAWYHGIPGSPGYNLDKELGTIRSRLMLQNLAKMKRQSPTGSTGLGPLSNAEGEILRSTVAPLDNALPAGELRQSLDRVREDTIRNQPGLTYDTAYDLSRGQSRATIPRGAYYKDKDGNIRVNKNGDAGNPIVRPALWAHMTPQERALWN